MRRAKVVLNSSAIIALSVLGRLEDLTHIFDIILIPTAVYEEICVKGRGLPGDEELRRAVGEGTISVEEVRDRTLVEELRHVLSAGEAEAIALALEEEADYVVLDDKIAREKALEMGLNVIGTLRILRMLYDEGLIDKRALISEIEELRRRGFWVSDEVIRKALEGLPESPDG